VFRALLRLLPFDFRIEHGREMEQVFRTQCAEARDEGTVGAVARLWLETVRDLLQTAPHQHVAMLWQDVGYTLRTLRRTPGFTAAALLTLALGISASASIFTIINAFLFRPLPVDRPEELVSIATLGDRHIEMPHGVSYRDLQDYGALTDVFAGLLGYQPLGVWLDDGSGHERVVVEAVTENSFSLLGSSGGRAYVGAVRRARASHRPGARVLAQPICRRPVHRRPRHRPKRRSVHHYWRCRRAVCRS
jgi:hypothetical protein